jgi:hypothetical protein
MQGLKLILLLLLVQQPLPGIGWVYQGYKNEVRQLWLGIVS